MASNFEKNNCISDSESSDSDISKISSEGVENLDTGNVGNVINDEKYLQYKHKKSHTLLKKKQDRFKFFDDELSSTSEQENSYDFDCAEEIKALKIEDSKKISTNKFLLISDSEGDSSIKVEAEKSLSASLCKKTAIEESKNKMSNSEVSSSTNSDNSIIDDSLQISKLQNNVSQNVVEESISEDSSLEGLNTFSRNDSVANNNSDIIYVSSINNSDSKRTNESISILKIDSDDSSNSESEVFQIEDSLDKGINSKNDFSKCSTSTGYSSLSFPEEHTTEENEESLQKTLSSEKTERSILERQIADKTTAFNNIMRAIHGCNIAKLKDGGKLLHEKMLRCKEELDGLKEKLKNFTNYSDDLPEITKSKTETNTLFSIKDQDIGNLGKKGIQTHRVEAALTIDALVTIHESLTTCPSEKTFEEDPGGLKVKLMPHQKHALAWLLWREKQIPSGGILADDMGLGKTLSIISLILRAEEYKRMKGISETEDEDSVQIINGHRTYKGNTLVVCPASLAGQWESQIKEHCKSNVLSVLIHHGRTRELQAKRLAGYDVVITTYGLIAEENKCSESKTRGILFRVRWERIVLDEAHIIRNHKTQKAVAACELMAKYRWCLTGTPVHNKELDMYSLIKFLRCSPFDDRTVWKRWVDNKSLNGVQRLKTVIKSILLRRTKDDLRNQGELKELPNKNLIPIYIDLDEEELKVYQKVLNFSKTLLAEYLHQRELHAGSNYEKVESVRNQLKSMEEIKTTEIFVLLLRLRQICCLPGLIHSFLEKETCIESGIEPENPIIEDLYTQLNRMSIGDTKKIPEISDNQYEKNVLVKSNPVFQINRRSSKIQALLKIIQEILETQDKIVIVSQWTNLLKKLEPHINSLQVDFVVLDGSVPVKFRSKIIDDFNRFNSSVRIMLLSLNAGGVGLNLVGGNRLIIFEPHWNPQLESQACDRIYRVGQRKQVYIYKIICKNTIEERIELLQKKKLELAANILEGVNPAFKSQMSQLTLPDLMTLFDVGRPM